jgi:hypothetical protein
MLKRSWTREFAPQILLWPFITRPKPPPKNNSKPQKHLFPIFHNRFISKFPLPPKSTRPIVAKLPSLPNAVTQRRNLRPFQGLRQRRRGGVWGNTGLVSRETKCCAITWLVERLNAAFTWPKTLVASLKLRHYIERLNTAHNDTKIQLKYN